MAKKISRGKAMFTIKTIFITLLLVGILNHTIELVVYLVYGTTYLTLNCDHARIGYHGDFCGGPGNETDNSTLLNTAAAAALSSDLNEDNHNTIVHHAVAAHQESGNTTAEEGEGDDPLQKTALQVQATLREWYDQVYSLADMILLIVIIVVHVAAVIGTLRESVCLIVTYSLFALLFTCWHAIVGQAGLCLHMSEWLQRIAFPPLTVLVSILLIRLCMIRARRHQDRIREPLSADGLKSIDDIDEDV